MLYDRWLDIMIWANLYIYIWNIYHVYVQFLYPAAILLGFIVVEIVFGLYFTIELYCRTLASNDLQMMRELLVRTTELVKTPHKL